MFRVCFIFFWCWFCISCWVGSLGRGFVVYDDIFWVIEIFDVKRKGGVILDDVWIFKCDK